jgi:predicted GNAT family N-acyltransferase
MPTLAIAVEDSLTDDVEALRRRCFPGATPATSVADEFDERSLQVTARVDGRVAASVRLTPGPRGPFTMWSGGRAQLADGDDVITIGRMIVDEQWRGYGLARLLCATGMIHATHLRFATVVAAIKENGAILNLMLRLGFVASGPRVVTHESIGTTIEVQPLVVASPLAHHDRWQAMVAAEVDALARRGVAIVGLDGSGCACAVAQRSVA